jgi:hypothetical protein
MSNKEVQMKLLIYDFCHFMYMVKFWKDFGIKMDSENILEQLMICFKPKVSPYYHED